MPEAKVRKRLPSGDRRESILDAAQIVFAELGFRGARTQQIADAAKVSEALLYRYFPSKRHLYLAVLRRAASHQDARFKRLKSMPPSTEALISAISDYMSVCASGREAPSAPSVSILLSSFARDNSYVRFFHRRSRKLWAEAFEKNIAASVRSGDAIASPLIPVNAYFFVEHVGMMMLATLLNRATASRYNQTQQQLVSDAVWFACRGIGVADEALRRYFEQRKEYAGEAAASGFISS